MKPIEFRGHNTVFAKDQPQYQPLPAWRAADGTVTSCWQLTWRERWQIFTGGRLWLSVLTFHGPLQPLLPRATPPTNLRTRLSDGLWSLLDQVRELCGSLRRRDWEAARRAAHGVAHELSAALGALVCRIRGEHRYYYPGGAWQSWSCYACLRCHHLDRPLAMATEGPEDDGYSPDPWPEDPEDDLRYQRARRWVAFLPWPRWL